MDRRDIDQGLTTISRYWVTRDQSALQLAYELQDAEAGILRENKVGQIAFEDRSFRAAQAVSATFGSGGLYLWNLKQEDPLHGISNYVEVQVRTFNISESVLLATVADVRNGQGGTPPTIPAGGSITIAIPFPTPSSPTNYIAVSEWGTVDLEVNTSVDGTGTDITNSDITPTRTEYADRIEVTLTSAYGSPSYAIVLRVHGTAIVEGDPIPVSAQDDTSIAAYGKRTYPNPSKWLTDIAEAQDYCDHIIAMNKDPRARLTFEVKANYDDAHLAAVQALDVSQKIHITADVATYSLGIDDDFYIEYLRHRVDSGNIHVCEVECRAVSSHEWPASGTAYTPNVVPNTDKKVPDDLWTTALSSGLRLIFGIVADKWNAGITEGEFRAKYYAAGTNLTSVDLRIPSEGGTLVHDGTTQLVITGEYADQYGLSYLYQSPAQGIWYYAGRLKNASGWSVWTDGNDTPQYVLDRIATEDPDLADTGPPADWSISVKEGTSGTAIVSVSRPQTNGHKIWGLAIQIKDATQGSWRDLDADAGAAETLYDGSAADHEYDRSANQISKTAETWGTAAVGDLVLIDVRGDQSWDLDYCEWGTIQSLGTGYIIINGRFNPRADAHTTGGVYDQIRIKIVKPPWEWNSEGYFGDEPNRGIWERVYWIPPDAGDTTTQTFVSDPIQIPAGLTIEDIQARAWFQNMYSRSDGGIYSDNGTGGGGTQGQGCVSLTVSAGEVDTDANLGSVFYINSASDYTVNNPTGNLYCGMTLLWMCDGIGVPTLDTKFNLMYGEVILKSGGRDLLGAIYNAADDQWDTFWKRRAITPSPSLSPSVSSSASAS